MTSTSVASRPATAPRARRDLPSLSGARAVAAYAVIVTHVGFNSGLEIGTAHLAGFVFHLDFGVTLFFLLSGFLLSRQLLARQSRGVSLGYRTFWRRRLLRLLPAYWLAIVVVLALLTPRHASSTDWLSYLLLVQTYDRHAADPSLSQMWTLAVELSFYFVLPLLIRASRWVRGDLRTQMLTVTAVMAVVALAANLTIHAVGGGGSEALLWLPSYLDWFALGMVLAVLDLGGATSRWQRAPIEWAQSPATCWAIGALLYWLSTTPLTGARSLVPESTWEWMFKHYLYGGAAFFFLAPLVLGSAAWTERLLGNRVMVWFGEISYGVYLWHLGLLLAFQRWIGWPSFTGHFWPLLAVTAGGATLAAASSWYVLEQPLLRRFSVSWRRQPVAAGQAPRQDTGHRDQTQHLRRNAVRRRVR